MTVRRARVRRPLLAPRFRFAVVPDEGVLLLSPAEDVFLEGSTYEAIVPLLDGRRTAEAIVDALGVRHDAAEVYYALGRLAAKGLIVSAPQTARRRRTRHQTLKGAPRVRLVSVAVDAGAIRRALRTAGWRSDSRSRTWLVIASDILAPQLAAIDASAKRRGKSWLLVVPHVHAPTIGPFFSRTGACFACLVFRMSHNRPLDVFLRAQAQAPRYAHPGVSLQNSVLLQRTLKHAAAQLAGQGASGVEQTLNVWNDTTRRWEPHPVPRRPQCPVCGDAKLYAASSRAAFNGAPVPALGTASLTSRRDLVDALTGVVTALEPRPVAALPPLHICVASGASTRARERVQDVLHDLLQQPSGRGGTHLAAATSALGEAVERFSGAWQGDEPRTRSSLSALGDRGIHPNDVMGYSAAQLRRRDRTAQTPIMRIPRPFDPSARMDWTPVYSLTRNEERWLPASLMYYGHPDSRRLGQCFADSNGCAAGETRDAALAGALLELIERDAVAIWWYNRLQRPPIDIASARDPWCDAMVQALRATGRQVWALDLTNDLAIPAVAAVARRLTGPQKILLGFGAHLDWRLALRRALGELGQMFAGTADGDPEEQHLGVEMRDWLTRATLRRHPYLRPSATARGVAPEPFVAAGDLAPRIVATLQAHRFEVFALDQTRPDLRVPVVRAIVPGLRHFWPRFRTGRLYEVPVAMRWLRQKRREGQLNPVACFL